jgi:hypothetical protein
MGTREFWRMKRGVCASGETPTADSRWTRLPRASLCEIALRLWRLPFGGAAVEWVFSHLRFLFGDYRHSLTPGLVEALLVIKLNREYVASDQAQTLASCLGRVVREDGGDPAAWMGPGPGNDNEALGDSAGRGEPLTTNLGGIRGKIRTCTGVKQG